MEYTLQYSGPILFRVKISDQDILRIKKLCSKTKRFKCNEKLAGIIEDEYDIVNLQGLVDILNPYVGAFREAYNQWYKKDFTEWRMKAAWVNYMVAGECNPPHIHTDGMFSSVLFTDIPKDLAKESKASKNNGSKPGEIHFTLYPHVDEHISMYSKLPEVGDFFIFPAKLVHSVNSFKSKGKRVSVAFNFDVKKA